jgi:ubiquitin C-terminal hydrolase
MYSTVLILLAPHFTHELMTTSKPRNKLEMPERESLVRDVAMARSLGLIGLGNKSNYCWLNAVCQSLFHLPEFKDLIMSGTFSLDIVVAAFLNPVDGVVNSAGANFVAAFLPQDVAPETEVLKNLRDLFSQLEKSRRKRLAALLMRLL